MNDFVTCLSLRNRLTCKQGCLNHLQARLSAAVCVVVKQKQRCLHCKPGKPGLSIAIDRSLVQCFVPNIAVQAWGGLDCTVHLHTTKVGHSSKPGGVVASDQVMKSTTITKILSCCVHMSALKEYSTDSVTIIGQLA